MAQLSSAQREPSMEEILASIRRIIEDSDLPKPAAEAVPTVEAKAEVAPAFDQPTFQELEAFSREPEDAAPIIEPTIVPPAANEDRPDAAMDFARGSTTDVQDSPKHTEPELVAPETASPVEALDWNLGVTDEAVINQLSEADFDLAEVADAVLKELSDEQAAEAQPVTFEDPGVDVDATASAFDAPPTAIDESVAAFDAPEDLADSPLAAIETSAAAAAPAPAVGETASVAVGEQANDTETSRIDEELPTAAIDRAAAVVAFAGNNEPPRTAIISEQAGRQVTASFNELSEAFAARGRKSLDQVAEDLIRPMLQDWLDNNLPTMVERLVREEIERIARGAGG